MSRNNFSYKTKKIQLGNLQPVVRLSTFTTVGPVLNPQVRKLRSRHATRCTHPQKNILYGLKRKGIVFMV